MIFYLAPTCTRPNVDIEDVGESLLNPRIRKRMYLFSVNAVVEFNCKIPKEVIYLWNVYHINMTTGQIEQMNVTDNPTHDKSEFLVMGNTLDYGMYMFEFIMDQFSVNFAGESEAIQVIKESYVQIIPTNIAVFGVEAGLSEFQIGNEQPLDLGDLIIFRIVGILSFSVLFTKS